MDDTIMGAFTVRSSGNIGQEIMDSDDQIIAWATNDWVAQVIARLLNENEHLFFTKKEN